MKGGTSLTMVCLCVKKVFFLLTFFTRFALVHQPDIGGLPDDALGVELIDASDRRGRHALLFGRRSPSVAEYFVSMRPGWLCYRFGQSVALEGYHPNRAARQFGFSQVSAYDGLPFIPGVADRRQLGSVPLETRLYAASMMWGHLLRFGTGAIFRLAPPDSRTGVEYVRLTWLRLSYAPLLEHGARRYERRVRELGLPRAQRSHRSSQQAGTSYGSAFSFDFDACRSYSFSFSAPLAFCLWH